MLLEMLHAIDKANLSEMERDHHAFLHASVAVLHYIEGHPSYVPSTNPAIPSHRGLINGVHIYLDDTLKPRSFKLCRDGQYYALGYIC